MIKEYILEHKDYYKELLKDNINLRNDLLYEEPNFEYYINSSFLDLAKETIVDDVTKSLAIDAESVYTVIEEIGIHNLLDII